MLVKVIFPLALFFPLAVSPCTTFAKNTFAGNSLTLTLSKNDVTCNGLNNGSITSAITGDSGGAVNYTLTPGSVTNTTGAFTNLSPGNYTVSADDGGIIATASVTINEPLILGSSITSHTNVLCKGGSTGSVTLAGSGGTPGYVYSIDGGLTYQAGAAFGSLAAGVYTVMIKDANWCTQSQPVTITEPASVLSSLIVSQTDVLCFGNSTGSVTVAGSGGTAGYVYSIDGGATWQASSMFGSLTVGPYTIKVRDAAGCIQNQAVLITGPATVLNATVVSQINVSCKGGTTGSVTVAGSGGTGGYTYSKDAGATWQAGGTFGTLASGAYTVIVKDANGCIKNQPVTITEPATVLGSSITAQTNVLCKGNATGSVTVLGSGGTGVYVYSIDGGMIWQASGTFGSLIAGAYTVMVRDANSCLKNQVVTITEPAVVLGISVSFQTNVLCKGNITGSVTVAGSGGAGGYVFSINGGSTWQVSGTFGALAAGPYNVIVKDASGCTKIQIVTITEPAVALSSVVTSQTNVSCKGGATGSVTIAGSGGTSGYTYSINGGATYQASGIFSALNVGSYTIRVKDANGCITDQPVTITEPAAALSVAASSNTPVCANAILNLSANSSGGTAPYSYSWTGPNAFTSTNQSPSIANPAVAASGSYMVTVTDANGCTAVSSVLVNVNAAPIVTASSSISSICEGGPVTLTSSSDIPALSSLPSPIFTTTNNSTGGTPANAAWTVQPDGYSTNGLTFNSNDNSSFYLSDSRSQNGTKTETILKTQSFNSVGFSTLSLNFWHYFRYNSSTNESATVQVSTDGSIWTTVATFTSTIGSSNSFSNQTIILNAYINKPSLYVRFYYYSDARARYWAIDNVTLSGTPTASGPIISWSSNPAGFSSTQANPPTVNPNVSTTYTVTYTNTSTNCSNSASTMVTVNPKPVVTIQPNYCAVPGHIRLTASGGTSYIWSTGETTNPIFVDIADNYSVSSTNAFGCTGTASLPVSTELVTNGDFTNGNTGYISDYTYYPDIPSVNNELVPDTGTDGYGVGTNGQNYHPNFWGIDHTGNATGPRNFMLVNGHGNTLRIWEQTVTVLPNTDYYFSAWAISLNSAGNYANLQFKVNGNLVGTTAPLAPRLQNNNPPFNWIRFYGNWNSGSATTAVIQIANLIAVQAGNDFGLDDVSFGTLAPIPFVIAPTVNPTATACSGKTMYLKSNIVGGRAPITYTWTSSNGFTSTIKDPIIPNASVLNSGSYTLSVVDGYGCDPVVGTTIATILPTPNPLITSISGSGTVCPLAQEKYWTTQQANVSSSWTITGGIIVGSAVNDTIEIKWPASGNGIISLKSINTINLCDSTVTKSVLIQDLIPPVINCPSTLNLTGCNESVISVNPYSAAELTIPLSQLTLAGGSASDNCAIASITYQDSKSGTNPVVVTRIYSATDLAGNKSSCAQTINIADNTLPTLVVPASFNFCVENVISAGIVFNALKINPIPDYFLFVKGNTAMDLNPADFSDNCTPANQLVLHWRIDFSGAVPPPSISGTGQPSAYTSDIIFPGDGVTFLDINHTITYWVVDMSGNESVHKTVTITIHPRPVVSYQDHKFLLDTIIYYCTKTRNHENKPPTRRFESI